MPVDDLGPRTAVTPGTTRQAFLRRAAVAGAAMTAGGALAGAGTAAAHGGRRHHRWKDDEASIKPHLNRVAWWDVNVADLEKARTWYETVTTLEVVAETSASQDFPSLGIRNGRFEGLMLREPKAGPRAPAIHLVEWKNPTPVGQAYASYANVGWNALRNGVDDLEGLREVLTDLGTPPLLPTSDFVRQPLHPNLTPTRYISYTARDHDGIYNQFFTVPGGYGAYLVSPSTVDLDWSMPFYLGLLGLDLQLGIGAPPPGAPNVYGGDGSNVRFDGVFWIARGDASIIVDHLVWSDTRANPTPYRSPVNRGIMRLTLEVDDVEACYDVLRRSRWVRNRHIKVSRPEEWNLGPAFGPRPVIEIIDPEGVRAQLIEQAPYPNGELHPYGDIFPGFKRPGWRP